MSHAAYPFVDVLVDLGQPGIGWERLHAGLEALDRAGFVPHHLHAVPPAVLAQIDALQPGTQGRQTSGGGAWLIAAKRADAPTFACGVDATVTAPSTATTLREPAIAGLVGMAGYGGTFPARLSALQAERGHAIAGPFLLDGPLVAHRLTLTHAALYALRERGFWRAVIPRVKSSALPALREYFGPAMLSVMPCVPPRRPRVVICASGSGSNLQAVIDAVAAKRLDFELVRVVCNKAGATAIDRATAAGIATDVLVWQRPLQSRTDYDEQLTARLNAAAPDVILLLGWMHLLAEITVKRVPVCLNIHPAYLPLDPADDLVVFPDGSELPALRGAHAVTDALTADHPWIGASVHRVTPFVDRGEILARIPLARLADESREDLEMRLHTMEHALLIAALHRWHEDFL